MSDPCDRIGYARMLNGGEEGAAKKLATEKERAHARYRELVRKSYHPMNSLRDDEEIWAELRGIQKKWGKPS